MFSVLIKLCLESILAFLSAQIVKMSSDMTPLHRLYKFDPIPLHIIQQLLVDNVTDSHVIFNFADLAPAPDKDYVQMVVTTTEVRADEFQFTFRPIIAH